MESLFIYKCDARQIIVGSINPDRYGNYSEDFIQRYMFSAHKPTASGRETLKGYAMPARRQSEISAHANICTFGVAIGIGIDFYCICFNPHSQVSFKKADPDIDSNPNPDKNAPMPQSTSCHSPDSMIMVC
jgi:hypothetical protein